MRRISANYIFPVSSAPLKNGIIEINELGVIHNIIDTKGALSESRNLEFYNGVIIPGFVNAHCHLELSYLKNKITPQEGLPDFLTNVVKQRGVMRNEFVMENISKHDALMKQRGIVAVADISNTNNTLRVKARSKIYYHTFVETIGLSNAQEIFQKQKTIYDEFIQNGLKTSITPHAPYSVSEELFLKIKKHSEKYNSVISIHNQESKDENAMFLSKSGDLVKALTSLGVDLSSWYPSGKKSVASVINWLPKENNILFVHNTYSTQEDIDIIHKNLSSPYWCLCPMSNLYIENKLPDFSLFKSYDEKVTLGTDSLASNRDLSILDEMKTIAINSDITFNQLLKWATLNGAKFLAIDNRFGSLEKGKKPGLNVITNFDFQKMHLSESSQIKVLC
ncbi:MAG: amidohydrolase family protein [Bacteroidetes bacterium]|nr:amidohydrolase family protein [Bacteroidota bacterium]